jgi:hypothetical protein
LRGTTPTHEPERTAVLGRANGIRGATIESAAPVARDEYGMIGKPAVQIGHSLDRKKPRRRSTASMAAMRGSFHASSAVGCCGIRRCSKQAINQNDDDLTMYPVVPEVAVLPQRTGTGTTLLGVVGLGSSVHAGA